MPEPKIGQVWESEDPRCGGRRVKIVQVLRIPDQVLCWNIVTGRETRIAVRRLCHTGKRGYQLVEEAHDV